MSALGETVVHELEEGFGVVGGENDRDGASDQFEQQALSKDAACSSKNR